jgi:hypothetical protein
MLTILNLANNQEDGRGFPAIFMRFKNMVAELHCKL